MGLVSAYYGGFIDASLMRLMDVLLAFPGILLGIGVVVVLGNGVENTALAVAVMSTPTFARLARGSALSILERDHVAASRALGASALRVIFGQVLPNALTPLVVAGGCKVDDREVICDLACEQGVERTGGAAGELGTSGGSSSSGGSKATGGSSSSGGAATWRSRKNHAICEIMMPAWMSNDDDHNAAGSSASSARASSARSARACNHTRTRRANVAWPPDMIVESSWTLSTGTTACDAIRIRIARR